MATKLNKESNFDLQAPVMTTDEIEILANAFNQVLHGTEFMISLPIQKQNSPKDTQLQLLC
ncbi:MAG: hypothetical protein V7K50_20955 [Nostoc sp.]|uniref:HAMP domain-containing protein n=1 Tax=Nostoc sp. TaxID=1180 RepID=UPI002FF4F80C